jgi:hypothetical protein
MGGDVMDALEFVNILVQDKHNMIETIFHAREEELAELNKSDINIMGKEKLEERHKKLIEAVNTIPEEYKKGIVDVFEKYSDSVDVVNAYFNKKYYKKRIKRWNQINN